MRPTFSPYDLAVLRVCRRNGWSIEQFWDGLSEWEQNEWLAYDQHVSQRAHEILNQLADKEMLLPDAYVALLLTTL